MTKIKHFLTVQEDNITSRDTNQSKSKNSFECMECNMKFDTEKRLVTHFRKAHPTKKGYEEINPSWHEPVSY